MGELGREWKNTTYHWAVASGNAQSAYTRSLYMVNYQTNKY